MSVIPASEQIDLIQGSTYDEVLNFYDGPGETNPHDFTGTVALWRFAKDAATPAFLTLTSVGKVTVPTDGSGLYLSSGVLRVYITDETTAALTETQFTQVAGCSGDTGYTGLNTLLLTPASGQATVENIGLVTFTPIAEPGP